MGPSNSNNGDISGYDSTPTFVETLVSQNQISDPIFGIYIAPPLGVDGTPQGSGEITFGGIDQSKIQGDEIFPAFITMNDFYLGLVGEVTWVQQNDPVNFHWEFNV